MAQLQPHRSRPRSQRARQSQEGAVMLVVLLILMVATASAAISVSTVQSELHAAGKERLELQARSVADAALATTIPWIEMLSASNAFMDSSTGVWNQNPPDMLFYPEPEIPGSGSTLYHHAARTTMAAEMVVRTASTLETDPLSNAVAYQGTAGSGGTGSAGTGTAGSSGSGATAGSGDDYVGSFGPSQAYSAPAGVGYVVDITDCQQLPAAATPGESIGAGSGSIEMVPLQCVLTARGRLVLDGTVARREWDLGAQKYMQDRFEVAHDARAEIITIVPK